MKLTRDEQWNLVFMLDKLLQHDFGDLPEFNQGEWSRKNVEALWRDLKDRPLSDLRAAPQS